MTKTDKKIEKIAKEFLKEVDKRGEGKKGTIDEVDLCLWKTEIGFRDNRAVKVCTLDLKIDLQIGDNDYNYYSIKFLLPVNGAVTMQSLYDVPNNVIDELLETVQCDTLAEMTYEFSGFYKMDYTKKYNIVVH